MSESNGPIDPTTSPPPPCWCGNRDLEPFGPDYFRCAACQALVSRFRGRSIAADVARVGPDEQGVYGKDYWFGHQQQVVGLPDLTARMRADLPERCAHWLRTLLTYKLPPAAVQEVGSAHGGLVALLRWAGYDAAGLELSPFVVDLARRTFDVPVRLGPIEVQPIAAGSLDAVVMMDVLEHLPDPLATVRHIAGLLRPDGVFVVQTPAYPAGTTFDELTARGDYFLNHLREPPEHLLLFSRQSAARLLAEAGLPHVAFEPAIFPQYDQYLVAARRGPAKVPPDEAAAALLKTPGGRLVQALLDATAERDLYLSEAGKRLDVINVLAVEVERLRKP